MRDEAPLAIGWVAAQSEDVFDADETKAGSSSRSAAMAAKRRSAPSSSLGGKNSNEKRGSPLANRLLIRMVHRW